MSKAIEWTGAHVRESRGRKLELAAVIAREGLTTGRSPTDVARTLYELIEAGTENEHAWRTGLRRAGLDDARIDREVKRVDGLATGRLVRETSERWKIIDVHGALLAERTRREDINSERAALGVASDRIVRVRVTRIRKAVP